MRRLALLAVLAASCANYVPVQSPVGDRLWLISTNGRQIIRCFDFTPAVVPYMGGLYVFCKEAEWFGVSSDPAHQQPSTTTLTK